MSTNKGSELVQKRYDRSSTPKELENVEDMIDLEALDREVGDDVLSGFIYAIMAVLGPMVSMIVARQDKQFVSELYDRLTRLDATFKSGRVKRLSPKGAEAYEILIQAFKKPLARRREKE